MKQKFNVDSKAEGSAYCSTRSQKKNEKEETKTNASAHNLSYRWMDGWLGFNGILSTQVAAISCLKKFKV